jgi:hypothetical protein
LFIVVKQVLDYWHFLATGGSAALASYHQMLCAAVRGGGGLGGAEALARPLRHLSQEELPAVIDQLIHRQGALNFSSGFLTGLCKCPSLAEI